MDTLFQDIRFGWRQLRRTPGFTVAAVLALALGIGATTAIFSVLDRVVLRPLPYPDPDRLTMVWEANDGKGLSHERISPVNFGDYRALSQVFEDAAAWWYPQLTLTETGHEPLRVSAIETTPNFFHVLGVQPVLGAGVPNDPVLFARDDRHHQPSAVARAVRCRSRDCREDDRAQRAAVHRRRRDAAGFPVSERHRRVAPHHVGRRAAQPRRPLHGIDLPPQAGQDARGGERRARRADEAPWRGAPVDQRRIHRARGAARDRSGRLLPARAVRAVRRGGVPAGDHVHECREPAARARHRPRARSGRTGGDWREPRPPDSPVPDRERAAGRDGNAARHRRCGGVGAGARRDDAR